MLDKTKRLTPVIALLVTMTSLPIAQSQANANGKQTKVVVKETPKPKPTKTKKPKVNLDYRNTKEASRSATRYSYASPKYNKAFAFSYMQSTYGWKSGQFSCLVSLWNRESGWRVNAHNRSSGAHGIPQSLPGSKMASAGPDWYNNPHTQIKWGLRYISKRYGNPCGALGHSNRTGWY